MKEVGPNDPRPNFREGDVATLVCPGCGQPIHITEFGEGGEPLDDPMCASIDEYVAAHFDVLHHWRFRLIRWLSYGWFP